MSDIQVFFYMLVKRQHVFLMFHFLFEILKLFSCFGNQVYLDTALPPAGRYLVLLPPVSTANPKYICVIHRLT
jgi:hypothetical protein